MWKSFTNIEGNKVAWSELTSVKIIPIESRKKYNYQEMLSKIIIIANECYLMRANNEEAKANYFKIINYTIDSLLVLLTKTGW